MCRGTVGRLIFEVPLWTPTSVSPEVTYLMTEAPAFCSGRLRVQAGQSSQIDIAVGVEAGVDLLPNPPASEQRRLTRLPWSRCPHVAHI